jgi:arylsulfatase A-like enzyme
MLESIDDGVGKIAAKLEELGIVENTILIFTSDNGGESNVTSNAPLRGGKSELYEGGIRVPLIVRWPRCVQKKVTSTLPTMNTDFYPTLLEAAGVKTSPKQKIDGISILANWKDITSVPAREFLAWHYPLDRHHFLGGVSAGAIRAGDWKLIEHFDTGISQLYSLADDPSEKRNLASENPSKVAELKAQLSSWRNEVGAKMTDSVTKD